MKEREKYKEQNYEKYWKDIQNNIFYNIGAEITEITERNSTN